MNPQMEAIRCTIMRGGTSKGIFLMENQLPPCGEERDGIIRAIFGSPDVRQIDGLGGADVLTSKLAIVGPPTKAGADVDYTFGQVSFVDNVIDYKGNCGNISSAVGPFAIDMGLVRAAEPVTELKIHMTNSGRILTAQVPVQGGKALVDGDLVIDGVPGSGAPIIMDWSDAVGGITGSLLPTGNVRDMIEVDGVGYEISLVDAGNPLVFIKAETLKMQGTESPAEIEGNPALMTLIEKIRGKCAKLCGLLEDPALSEKESPYNPFFAIISPAADYTDINGKSVAAEDIHMVSRLLFMQKMHKTYPITGTVCTGAAAKIPGSLVQSVLDKDGKDAKTLKIGHPSGIIPVDVLASADTGSHVKFEKIGVYRTARMIMDGYVYVRNRTK